MLAQQASDEQTAPSIPEDPSLRASLSAQRRSVSTMPPEEMTDTERERVETIKRNNQVFQSLGVTTLAAAVKSKGKAREESDPPYEPEDMEETGDALLDELCLAFILVWKGWLMLISCRLHGHTTELNSRHQNQ